MAITKNVAVRTKDGFRFYAGVDGSYSDYPVRAQCDLAFESLEELKAWAGSVQDLSGDLKTLYSLWDILSDVMVDEDEEGTLVLEEPFLHFDLGTTLSSIWHWFEGQNESFVVGDVMNGVRRAC